ncbi:MAG: N-acetyltransferase [Pseudomonadota bacterium]
MIRDGNDADLPEILKIHTDAFGGDAEACLVSQMLRDPTAHPCLSLIAEEDGQAIGHVLFTPVTIDGAARPVVGAILAPLAVSPDHQGKGAGSDLVRHGLARLASDKTEVVFVYGDPDYYGRFGFKAALSFGLRAPNPLPPNYERGWTVLAPDDVLKGLSGTVQCCDVLNRPEYW